MAQTKNAAITNIGHIGIQMENEAEMLEFYAETLGLKPLFTLTCDDLRRAVQGQNPGPSEEFIRKLEQNPEQPWIRYMKLSDRQYLELFFNLGGPLNKIEDRTEYYGFQKVTYETDRIEELYRRITDAGAEILREIHIDENGIRTFSAQDPDGNEICFSEYTEKCVLPLGEGAGRESCSPLKFTTQVTFQVKNAAGMEEFYCRGLGLKKVCTLAGADYVEAAPHQFLVLLHDDGAQKKEERDLSGYYGYQHICLEVSDIHAAWDAVIQNGLKPDTEVSLGVDGAYQFWLTDPDGNRLELMQYTAEAKQLM